MKLFSHLWIILSFTFCCRALEGLWEGSPCQNRDGMGTCKKQPECPQAKNDVKNYGYHNFTRCCFQGLIEIVCCPTSLLRSSSVPLGRKCEEACNEYLKIETNIVFPQIAGGKNARWAEFPHMAALGLYSEATKTYGFKCGGTLISNKYLVTAAHCILNIEKDELKIVRLGVLSVPESTEVVNSQSDHKVKNYTIHPKYQRRHLVNDIALIELEKPVNFSDSVRPTCLYTNDTYYPQEFIITGWGETNDSGHRSSILQKASVSFVPAKTCKERYAKFTRPIETTQLCAGSSASDTCPGDSGGPLLMRYSSFPVLVGITSFGMSGCSGGHPSAYTSIATNLEWIEGIVWK